MTAHKVCILSFSNIAWDSRVLREIEVARQQHAVTVIAYGDWTPPESVHYIPLKKIKKDRCFYLRYGLAMLAGKLFPATYDSFFWSRPDYREAVQLLAQEHFDLIHANDWDALPVAYAAWLKTGGKVLFDAHEFSVGQEAEKSVWKMFVAPFRDYLLRKSHPCTAGMITVSPGLQDLYRNRYGWDAGLVMNARAYNPIQFKPVDPRRIDIVHHGGAIRNRYIEDLIRMTSLLDERYHLTLILIPNDRGYIQELKELAAHTAPERIHFMDAVPPKELLDCINHFDMGIPAMRVQNLNNFNALPNKFFDYVLAGLSLAVTPLPSMQQLIQQHQIGVVCKDQTWQSMAKCLNQLTAEEIDAYKRNALELAKTLNAETEMRKLAQIYQDLLEG